VEITISAVTAIRLTDVLEFGLDEDDIAEGEEPYYRTLTIETDTGTLAIDLEAVTRDALQIVTES
jgi:hypothetical protein